MMMTSRTAAAVAHFALCLSFPCGCLIRQTNTPEPRNIAAAMASAIQMRRERGWIGRYTYSSRMISSTSEKNSHHRQEGRHHPEHDHLGHLGGRHRRLVPDDLDDRLDSIGDLDGPVPVRHGRRRLVCHGVSLVSRFQAGAGSPALRAPPRAGWPCDVGAGGRLAAFWLGAWRPQNGPP